MFTLTKHELEAFEAMCSGRKSIKEIGDGSAFSKRTTYRLIGSLREKGLVQGNGAKADLQPSTSLHSVALMRYVKSNRHPLEAITGAKLLILISVSSSAKSLGSIAMETRLSRETVRVLGWSLRNSAVLTMEDNILRVPTSNSFMTQFLQDFGRGANIFLVRNKNEEGTVLWSDGLECIFSAASATDLEGVSPTAASAFPDYGIKLFGYTNYYHLAHWHPKLRVEDIALHQLLLDPESTRGISYSMLLLKKAGYERGYLETEARRLRIGDLVADIIGYLSGIHVANPLLPEKADFEELLREYGVI